MAEIHGPIKDLSQVMDWKDYVRFNCPKKFWVFFILSLNAGLQAKPLLNQKWDTVLWNEDNTAAYILAQNAGKAPSKRLRLNGECNHELTQLRMEFPRDRYIFQSSAKNISNRYVPYSLYWLENQLVNSAREAGIDQKVGWVTLRKTFGYHMVATGKWTLGELCTYFEQVHPEKTAKYCQLPIDSGEVIIPDVFMNWQ